MKLTLPDTAPHLPSAPLHGFGRCACHPAGTPPTRRLFTGLLLGGAACGVLAQDGVSVKDDSAT